MRVRPHIPSLLLALAACGDGPTPVVVVAPERAVATTAGAQVESSQAADAERPFSGRCETTLDPAIPLGPGVIRQVDRGTCTLAHLGRADFLSDKTIQLMAGTQTTIATFTAANGDVLRATGAGTFRLVGPGRGRFTATLTFVGGTGRFAGATGSAAAEGETDLVARTASLNIEGWVRYDAAARAP